MREFQRGAVRMQILYHAAEMEVHGKWITEELARHGYQISPGTLYPTLHRLEADGLLTSKQRVVDGRARRLYRATKAGKAALAEDRKALAELAGEILDAADNVGGSAGQRSPADAASSRRGRSRASSE